MFVILLTEKIGFLHISLNA